MDSPLRSSSRPRPLSYAFPSSASATSTTPASFAQRPTSPPLDHPPSPGPSSRLNRRPTYAGHRTTSSLSSLAQLNITPGASSSTPPLGPGASPALVHSPTFTGYQGFGLERSPSIGQWGGFGSFGAGAAGAGNGVGREYEDVQNRTFCKWLNARLEPLGYPPITDLGVDFCDGTRLIQLVEVLTEVSLGRYNREPHHRVQKMENAKQALERIKEMGVHLTNIGPEDIVDGNRKLILGMIWSLVLRFSIADINEEGSHAKEGLLLWCQRKTAPYEEVDVKDFTRSWQDGLAFCALIHRHRPDLLDYDSLPKDASHASAASNLARAFKIADEHLGIPQLLDVEDVCGTKKPDERSVMTYVAQFFHAFSSKAQQETEARVISNFVDNMKELMLAVHDYERRVTALLSAISAHLETLHALPAPTSSSYQTLRSLLAAFTSPYLATTRRAWLCEKEDTAALLGNVQTKLKTYGLKGYEPAEGLRIKDVDHKWTDLELAEQAQLRDLSRSIRRIQQTARQRFVEQGNKLAGELRAAERDLAAISGPLESQAPLARSLQSRLPALEASLAALEAAEQACTDCDVSVPVVLDAASVDGEDVSVHSCEALGVELGWLRDNVARRIAFVENQVVARRATTATPEQLEEWESAFRAFDKDGSNALDLDELSGALGSLGISEVNLDDIAQVGDEVTFEEFIRFLTERAEDRLTGEKVRSCFRSVAAEKGFVTELDLARLQLDPSALRFLQEHMPQRVVTGDVVVVEGSSSSLPGGEDDEGKTTTVFDYEAFLGAFLE
ncbi:hypothetical protein JCM1840_001425 [Sporobolomyces johnsonii]